jgi:hypothetical protein
MESQMTTTTPKSNDAALAAFMEGKAEIDTLLLGDPPGERRSEDPSARAGLRRPAGLRAFLLLLPLALSLSLSGAGAAEAPPASPHALALADCLGAARDLWQ